MTPHPTAVSPSRAVLAQIESGAGSVEQIASATGLNAGLVSVVIDRLVDAGYLTAQPLRSGCPQDGCSSCPTTRGCPSSTGARTGPVMITLGSARR